MSAWGCSLNCRGEVLHWAAAFLIEPLNSNLANIAFLSFYF